MIKAQIQFSTGASNRNLQYARKMIATRNLSWGNLLVLVIAVAFAGKQITFVLVFEV